MNPSAAVSRRYPPPLASRRLFADARAVKIAIFSLPLLLAITAPVRAQTPAAPRPTQHEVARPANTRDFLGWFRQFAPIQHRQSRTVSPPPLPRPRPAELAPTSVGPSRTSEELAPAALEPETPTEVARQTTRTRGRSTIEGKARSGTFRPCNIVDVCSRSRVSNQCVHALL
jgi:hypothetical protein